MNKLIDSKIELRHEIFTPSSPIKNRKYFFGREQEIKDLENVLKRSGQHAIVIGDRGVGKTSLVKQVLSDCNYKTSFRTCNPESSFDSVFRDLLKGCGIDFRNIETTSEATHEGELKGTPFGLGASGKRVNKKAEKYTESKQEPLTNWTVFECLKTTSEKLILVIDEYDALRKSSNAQRFHKNTAYTIKTLSDHNDQCDSRIIIVGVSSSSNELLGKHESIQRCAREIYLRPLRPEDIYDFLNLAEDELSIRFEDAVRERLAKGSYGYPYFVHLIGLECIEEMLRRNVSSRTIIWNDFYNAVMRAVDQAFRAELVKYRNAFDPADSIERSIIDGLAIYNKPSPKRADIRKFVCTQSRIEENAFESALNKLAHEKHFLYIYNDEVRFADPLMKAFIKERILCQRKSNQSLDSSQLRLFYSDE